MWLVNISQLTFGFLPCMVLQTFALLAAIVAHGHGMCAGINHNHEFDANVTNCGFPMAWLDQTRIKTVKTAGYV